MCYVIITSVSLVWFLCTLVADMLVAVALVTPKWLIGPGQLGNWSQATPIAAAAAAGQRLASVGIYTRCKQMQQLGYHCGRFDLDGFATDGSVYPLEWKVAMFFMSLGLVLLSLTVAATLLTCCRQSAFGKSIHNMTACAQVLAGIAVMLALFLHPLGWRAPRVQRLCGPEAEPFYPADCSIGISFYCGLVGILLTFAAAGISLKAESSNMRTRVRRRVESGSKLVCIP
ncbi:LHFPL tetraspan subfamily member 2a protein [Drosophila novamexicana]|uniref:LHFPL tetraspan subfamily member 2a protein n=1 Tax=Drosophila novamexicana TaxID=47314 RepID=UPI0011E5E346|nr:LHFPL tetraspan subfamily member 2a protein [Drosophila novamexicana]